VLQEEGRLSSRRISLQGFAQRESLQAIRFCLSHFLGTIATQTLTGRRLGANRSFASVRSVCAIRSSAMADGANKLMTRVTTGLGFVAASARNAKRLSRSFPFSPYPTRSTVWSHAVRRCDDTFWTTVLGKARCRISKIRIESLTLPLCAAGSTAWILRDLRFAFCDPPWKPWGNG
jgi:hypothetical protein